MRIHDAYTGEVTEVDHGNISSLDAFRSGLASKFGVEQEHLLLLVAPGATTFRLDKVHPGDQVFLYDRQLVSHESLARSRDSKALPDIGLLSPDEKRAEAKKTGTEIRVIDDATQLALAHMNSHLRTLAKSLRVRRELWGHLADDAAQCKEWESVWNAAAKVQFLAPKLKAMYPKDGIAEKYTSLLALLDQADAEIQTVDREASNLRVRAGNLLTATASQPRQPPQSSTDLGSWHQAKKQTQDRLVSALGEIAAVQHRVGELRPRLDTIHETLNQIDGYKMTVAQVLDLPFLAGALLIERERRNRWTVELRAHCDAAGDRLDLLRDQEMARIDQWNRYYRPVMGRVGFDLEKEEVDLPQASLSVEGGTSHPTEYSVEEYLRQLQRAGLDSTYSDLLCELDAMTAQLSQTLALPPLAEAKAQYTSRIRQLETALLQLRLSNGNQEHASSLSRRDESSQAGEEPTVPDTRPSTEVGNADKIAERATEISELLWKNTREFEKALNGMGLLSSRSEEEGHTVNRVKGLGRNPPVEPETPASVRWAQAVNEQHQNELFQEFQAATQINYDAIREAVSKRFSDVERLARKLQAESRQLREQRLALHSFRSGDLILFLPTRDPARQPNTWAAFNAGAPHYFLHPDHAKLLVNREYLIARAAGVESRKVRPEDGPDANPFGLAMGQHWYLITVHGEWGL